MSLKDDNNIFITSPRFIFTILSKLGYKIIEYCLFLFKNKRLVQYSDINELYPGDILIHNEDTTYIFNIGIRIIERKYQNYRMLNFYKYVNRIFI